MIVIHLFVVRVTGVMNIRPIMKSEYVIDAMPFIVRVVMKWISVRIVERLCVEDVELFAVVNSVDAVCARIVLLLVDDAVLCFVQGMPSLQWSAIRAKCHTV
mmetsp:Transcript_13590/g.19792  ORF Transcript_13590/g.19792 Transcript_13590/m.19792 type:complete len:102 (+) Transcript_13590:980-1285(+)